MCVNHSVVSNSLWSHGLQLSRLFCPWEFSRQEYWSGLPCPPQEHIPNPGIKPQVSCITDRYLNGLVVLLYFLQFTSEFCNKEFMIWATVSSSSCFCWLYRSAPSSAVKIIIKSILTIWWSPYVESSLVLLKEGVCCNQCILLENLLAFSLLYFVLQDQTCLLLQVFLDFLLLHPNPLWQKGHLFFGISSEMSCESS